MYVHCCLAVKCAINTQQHYLIYCPYMNDADSGPVGIFGQWKIRKKKFGLQSREYGHYHVCVWYNYEFKFLPTFHMSWVELSPLYLSQFLTVVQTEICKLNEIAFHCDPPHNLQFCSCNAEMFIVWGNFTYFLKQSWNERREIWCE